MGKSSLLLRYCTVTAATLFSFSQIFSGTFQVPYIVHVCSRRQNKKITAIPIFRFTDDQYDPELAATIGVDFKVKVGASFFWLSPTVHMEVLWGLRNIEKYGNMV